jgi:hypothetical protein
MAADPRFSRHIPEVFPTMEGLLEAGEAVESLLSHPGWLALQTLIAAERSVIDRDLDRTSIPLSQAEYALAHGRRDGLSSADEAATALIGRYQSTLRTQQLRHERGSELPQEATR